MFDGYCLIQSPSTAVTLAPHGTHRPLAACARQASLGHAQVRCASPLRRTSAAQHRRNPPSRGLGLDFWVECSWLLVAPRCCNRLPRHHHHLFILEWKWSFVRKAPHRRAPLHATPSACKALATRGGEKHVRARCGCTLHSARCARLTMRSWQAEQDRLEAKQQVCRSPPPTQLSRACRRSGLPTCRPAQNAWGGRRTVLRTVQWQAMGERAPMSPVWAAGVQAQGGEPQAARAPHGGRAVPCKGQERLTRRNPSSSDRLLFRCRLQEACLLKLSCGAPAAACHGGGAGFCWLDCGLAIREQSPVLHLHAELCPSPTTCQPFGHFRPTLC